MANQSQSTLPSLYLEDETAWLEQTAQLVTENRWDELDVENLREFLLDMAKRDRREVLSRLTVLLIHLLKWNVQLEHRTNSWRSTIETQQEELHDLLESGVLRAYAEAALDKAYRRAVKKARRETNAPEDKFAETCPYRLEDLLAE
jgi:hypothetical protein